MTDGPRPADEPVLNSVLRALELVVSRSTRIPILLTVAYVAGFAGVAVSVYGAGDPTGPLTTVGLALMAVSFLCLFVVSITFHSLTNPGAR